MPAYEAEKFIAEAIQSVLDQTYKNWELLVVDDGSTDKIAEIVRRLVAKENRVKYIFQPNGMLCKARNTGIRNASGPLIAFLDSDDVSLPEKLERQIQILLKTGVDVVYTEAVVFYEPGSVPGPTEFLIYPGKIEGPRMFDLLLLLNRIPVSSVLLQMDRLKTAGPFVDPLPYHGCEDYDLWLRLAAGGAVFYGITDKLVRYRRHAMAMTHKESKVLKPMLRVVSRHLSAGTLIEDKKNARLRRLYRDLIAALLEEGELAEAQEFLKEFSAWDKSGVVTSLQKLLMKVSPRNFNVISRECLYFPC